MGILLLAATTFLAYAIFVVIYRLTVHPLRRYPGPSLAALTVYYRLYYDVFCHGSWLDHLKELHQVYGPVVRVGPRELSFSVPDAYDDIHLAKFIKDPSLYQALPSTKALPSVINPREAGKRRTKLGPYFSRKAVLDLEFHVQRKVDKLVEALSAFINRSEPVDLLMAYRSVSIDIIMSYLFSQSINALDAPDFHHPLNLVMDTVLSKLWIQRHFLSFLPLDKIPPRLLRRIAPAMAPYLDVMDLAAKKADEYSLNPPSTEDTGHRLIFDTFLDEHLTNSTNRWNVPYREMIDECVQLQFAGSDTVGNTCMVGTYHLLKEPSALTKLRKELVQAWPDLEIPQSYETLEKLPYLSAVIKESLRLSLGAVTPLPRVVESPGAIIAGYEVPPDTIVSCGSYFVHMNESIFPDPQRFIPERWIGPNARELEKYLVSFSKGSRLCIGINLAWCELYLIFANIFRKLNMTIDETDGKEPSLEFRDYVLPLYCDHVRAFVRSKLG